MNLFVEFSLIIVLATAVSLLMKLLKQPLVVGYIVGGIIVGPYVLNILQSRDYVELFSKIGVAVLLFIVGLTLNPDVMREVGKVSVVTGIGQVLFTALIGFLIVRLLGFDTVDSFYVAVALTFSSTIIILKLLSDRGDVKKLYGKISIGFLLVQDIVATVLLLAITLSGAAVLSGAGDASGTLAVEILLLLFKGSLAFLVLYLVSRFVLPGVSRFAAGYQEVLFLFSLAWGFGISALFYMIGFSIEIGALVAGVTLAASPFAYEITSRMKPLRDFFIMLFFILLGSQIVLSEISGLIVPAIILSTFVLVGNPLIVLILMNLLGYRTRTAFMAGLTVAQISEFSLILVALGLSLGHLSQEIVSLVTLVGVITISGSTYLIIYAEKVYAFMKPVLKLFLFKRSHMEEGGLPEDVEIIIFGYDRVGHEFVEASRKISDKLLVVDFNPLSIEKLEGLGVPCRYGDAEDVEFLEEIGLSKAKLVVSTIPDLKTNLLVVSQYKRRNSSGIIITISHNIESARELYATGASYVVMPHQLGAVHAASLIASHQFDSSAFEKERDHHLEKINNAT